MMHSHNDYIVVGAGIVGLATALHIHNKEPDARIMVLEKASEVGTQQTSHNSGVVHAGIYYKPNSLKAQLCTEGRQLMKQFCQENQIPYREIGKLIVAKDNSEISALEKLIENAAANRVPYSVVDQDQIGVLAPGVIGMKALFSPETAIVDYLEVTKKMAELLQRDKIVFIFDCNVKGVAEANKGVELKTTKGDFSTTKAVFCTGLNSDRTARLGGFKHNFRIIPFKGTYYESKKRMANYLIYPVPNPELPFLGVHYTEHIDGSKSVGPNAALSLTRGSYKRGAISLRDTFDAITFIGFWRLIWKYLPAVIDEARTSLFRSHYLTKVQKMVADVTSDDLGKTKSFGIRAQLVNFQGKAIDDFLFLSNVHSLHVLNAPSPAATASLAIAKHIYMELKKS